MPNWRAHLSRLEAIYLAAALFVIIQAAVHWHPGFRSAFAVEAEGIGKINEYQTIWLHRYSQALRSLDFTRTFYLVNPRSVEGDQIRIYFTQPPLPAATITTLHLALGESIALTRSIVILAFVAQAVLLFLLARQTLGRPAAWTITGAWLAQPVVQSHAAAFSTEGTSLVFLLGAFLLAEKLRPKLAIGVFFLALASSWMSLLWLPFFLYRLQRERPFLAGLSAPLFLLLPLTYFAFLWGRPVDHQTGLITQFPAFPERGLTNLTPYIFARFTHYSSGVAQLVSGETLVTYFARFRESLLWTALPFFALGLARLRRFPAWIAAAGGAGAVFALAFHGAILVHHFMMWWLALFFAAVAGWGMMPAVAAIQTGRDWRRAAWAALLIAFSAEFLVRISLPVTSRAHAELAATVAEESRKINELLPAGRQVYIVKDFSRWGPDPFPIYLTKHTAVARVVWPDEACPATHALVLEYDLPEEKRAKLSEQPGCQSPLFSGKALRLLPGHCACQLEMLSFPRAPRRKQWN